MIPADFVQAARQWREDPALMTAIYEAEGGTTDTLIKAVGCSTPVQNRAEAVDVTCRTLAHARRDFIHAKGLDAQYVDFLASRWAPRGVANDPTDLNANWAGNVKQLWLGISKSDVGADIPGGGAA